MFVVSKNPRGPCSYVKTNVLQDRALIVVEVVVVDSSRGNEGVDKHRYHGMCVCVSDIGSAPQETTQPLSTKTTERGSYV